MDVQVLRFWGLIVGSALIAAALWIAALGAERGPAQTAGPGVAATAQAQSQPATFLVSFRGSGPIARAQSDARRGRLERAGRRVEIELQRQSAFVGLCFDRFTADAAEVVLRTCEPVAAQERSAIEARLLSRLRSMRAVAYADINASAAPEAAPG
jgi:hypothetical protein